MKKILTYLTLIAFPAIALATPSSHEARTVGTLLSAVALNATAATRTITLTEQNMRGFSVAALFIDFNRTAATDVSMTCTGSMDAGTTYFQFQSCDVSAGDCTSTDASWTRTISANDEFIWRVDTMGIPRVQCLFAGTSAGGSDTVTVSAYAIAQ